MEVGVAVEANVGDLDVFLGHSHRDAGVENLAQRLEGEQGFRIWFDKWMLVTGTPRQPDLARARSGTWLCGLPGLARPEVGSRTRLSRPRTAKPTTCRSA